MIPIRICFDPPLTERLPREIEIKVGRPVKLIDLVLMVLQMQPVLSDFLPAERTEAFLQQVLRVTANGRELRFSEPVPDACDLLVSLR